MNRITKRVLISFDGLCPYNCKHCYTYEIPVAKTPRTIEQLVNSIEDDSFDVVYISQKKENYIIPEEGLSLCEAIFDKYNCNIMTITRSVFETSQRERFVSLHNKMKSRGKHLFLGISIIGLDSSAVSEDFSMIPTPEERIEFAKEMYNFNVNTLLLIRPLFPNKLIPINELKQIIDNVKGNISCVLSGALMINTHIIKRLNIVEEDMTFLSGGESEYLDGAISHSMKFVDIRNEMSYLKDCCVANNVPFFEHSIPALNYLIGSIRS